LDQEGLREALDETSIPGQEPPFLTKEALERAAGIEALIMGIVSQDP
jgi:hypothetical protein